MGRLKGGSTGQPVSRLSAYLIMLEGISILWRKSLKHEVAKMYEEHEDLLIESLRVLRARGSIFASSRFKRLFYLV
jgi:hypothetical protein